MPAVRFVQTISSFEAWLFILKKSAISMAQPIENQRMLVSTERLAFCSATPSKKPSSVHFSEAGTFKKPSESNRTLWLFIQLQDEILHFTGKAKVNELARQRRAELHFALAVPFRFAGTFKKPSSLKRIELKPTYVGFRLAFLKCHRNGTFF